MARQRAPQQPTVERRIHFYRLHCGTDNRGRPIVFDAHRHLTALHGMATDGRYQLGPDNTALFSWVDQTTATGRLRLGTIRRGGFPQVEQNGNLSPLSLTANSGLAEVTHLSFFDDNILGAVFNFYGPRPTRLAPYLLEKTLANGEELSVEPLLRRDVLQELQRLQTVRLFDLRIRASYADTVRTADDSLGRAFEAAARAGDSESVQVTLRSGRSRASHLAESLIETARQLVRGRRLREEASHFVIGGIDRETSRSIAFDLLSDKLVASRRIVQQGQRSRALEDDSAYRAIEDAHTELRDELTNAAGVAT